MKSAVRLLVIAAALAAPVVSFAQSANAPVTRAEVAAQLQQLEQAGYKPSKSQYPDDIQAAEARIAQSSGVGSNTGATSQSGYRATPSHDADASYRHH
jgi:type II secretory pathway pseudopilin PulG